MKSQCFICMVCFFICTISIFADGVSGILYVDYPFSVKFSGDEIVFTEVKDGGDTAISRKGRFVITYEYSIPFLNINYDDGENIKQLMIKNDNICALLDEAKLIFLGAASSFNQREGYLPPSNVTATSFLTEKDKTYTPENLTKNPYSENPWAEGVNGQGIGEKLYIRNTIARELYISIGFVSYTRPYLYIMNSRPKELKFSVDGKFSFIQHLSDTPEYQKIIFPEQVNRNDILIVEIISVYEGTMYQDTCINSLIVKMW
ncbi:NADase-type glycan-binding domain-containing protein [Breznakiella homolactica]|uniref:NAD glycohydrolase translocation F5/8 type C domain-containing protein n=1 Tax=Breznakiella homolactica TaxID=2798577 RepID=A0A7T8BBN3_9SPIR|nr:hypothetical protein [Breznakiella homolactica]QQO10757.1 hypothetical protein JFL75_07530 [Breznakiella homolactica]